MTTRRMARLERNLRNLAVKSAGKTAGGMTTSRMATRKVSGQRCIDQALSSCSENDDLHVVFDEWAKKHGKEYKSKKERVKSFNIFRASEELVDEHNSLNPGSTLLLSWFADLRVRCGVVPSHVLKSNNSVDCMGTNEESDKLKEVEEDLDHLSCDLRILFDKWQEKYGIKYSCKEERKERFQFFCATKKDIDHFNSLNDGAHYGLHEFSERELGTGVNTSSGVEKMARITACHRILGMNHREIMISGEPAITIPDSVFGFLDEESDGSNNYNDAVCYNGENDWDNEEEDDNDDLERENPEILGKNKNFWDTQNQLLQATLCRTSSIESKVRKISKDLVKENGAEQKKCICGKSDNKGYCRSCLMKEICVRLQNGGFNSAICKSKWSTSPHIPSGEHTFLDVVDNSNTKRSEVRIIIELNFRAEFEMARAGKEYNQLVEKLPEIFVGKTERLLSLIKILCCAAKKCMKDKKMHIAPWRKQPYMQAKWVRICERRTTLVTPLSSWNSKGSAQPKARSMLTVDMLENLPNIHRTVVVI